MVPCARRSKCECLGKVVLKGKLDAKIVRLEAIQKILSSSPLKLTAHHRALRRIEEQVAETVVTAAKRVRRLSAGVVDVQKRVSNGGAETLVPVVIEEGHHAPHWKSNTCNRTARIDRKSVV